MLKMLASGWLTSCTVKCSLTGEGGEAVRMAMTWMKQKEVSEKGIAEQLAMELMNGLKDDDDFV